MKIDLLRSLGLEGLLLDLDCTLKDYHANRFHQDVVDWVTGLKSSGIALCLLSNAKPSRIEPFARALQIPFVAKALKPSTIGCHVAVQKLRLKREQTGLIGDQIFSDVLAGRLAGLFTILVQPTSSEEPWFTRVKRPLERQVLRWINRSTKRPDLELPPINK
ncbi:MAG: YqeG family HAD IIIA-type phosphatase [Deltaproteobacteria bacterium]|nr:YqeG family HAD IIIA-type phosphatase [Deltaproteobacteria bacterium]